MTVYLVHHTATARREAKHYILRGKPKRENARGERTEACIGPWKGTPSSSPPRRNLPAEDTCDLVRSSGAAQRVIRVPVNVIIVRGTQELLLLF